MLSIRNEACGLLPLAHGLLVICCQFLSEDTSGTVDSNAGANGLNARTISTGRIVTYDFTDNTNSIPVNGQI